jgi:hypothetical protein
MARNPNVYLKDLHSTFNASGLRTIRLNCLAAVAAQQYSHVAIRSKRLIGGITQPDLIFKYESEPGDATWKYYAIDLVIDTLK